MYFNSQKIRKNSGEIGKIFLKTKNENFSRMQGAKLEFLQVFPGPRPFVT